MKENSGKLGNRGDIELMLRTRANALDDTYIFGRART